MWKLVKIEAIFDLGSDIGLVKFVTEEDLFHVWNNGPWNYFNNLITLEKLRPFASLSHYDFIYTCILIHFHSIPITHRSISIAIHIGELVGTPFVPKRKEVKKWINFIRIKVLIDTFVPHCESVEFSQPKG